MLSRVAPSLKEVVGGSAGLCVIIVILIYQLGGSAMINVVSEV